MRIYKFNIVLKVIQKVKTALINKLKPKKHYHFVIRNEKQDDIGSIFLTKHSKTPVDDIFRIQKKYKWFLEASVIPCLIGDKYFLPAFKDYINYLITSKKYIKETDLPSRLYVRMVKKRCVNMLSKQGFVFLGKYNGEQYFYFDLIRH